MIHLQTLGSSVIQIGAHRIGPKAEVLFASTLYLALERGKAVARTTLLDLLWPDCADDLAGHRLRQTLFKLRKMGVSLESTQGAITLLSPVDADVLTLDAAENPGADWKSWDEFLPGYRPSFSPRFAQWLDGQREAAHGHLRTALLGLLKRRRAEGRWHEVDEIARKLLDFDPLNEDATMARAESAALVGNRANAISILDRYVGQVGEDSLGLYKRAASLRTRIAERPAATELARTPRDCFVGRESSLAILNDRLARARLGRGGALLLWGAKGSGKSRLIDEFHEISRLHGTRVERAACHRADIDRAGSLFSTLLPALLARRGAAGRHTEYDEYFAPLRAPGGPDTTPLTDLAAPAALSGLRRALVDLVDALASEGCLPVIVEDVHWMDATSSHLLGELVAWSTDRRVLFILTGRHSREPAEGLEVLPLPPLSDDAARTLLRTTVAGSSHTLDDATEARFVALGEGNPLFLRELSGHFAQTGDVTAVPPLLTASVSQRIGRLGGTALRALQGFAILGEFATAERLEAMLNIRSFDLVNAVEELESQALVLHHQSRLAARHDVIESAALARLTTGARRLLHRQAAATLEHEVLTSDSLAALWACTAQLRHAENVPHAARFACEVATSLLRRGRAGDAASIAERALLELRDSPANDRELLVILRDALRLQGHAARLLEVAAWLRADGQDPELHDDLDLDLIEAERMVHGASVSLFQTACRRVEDHAAPAAHRIRAAPVALRLADACGAHSHLPAIYSAVASLFSEPGIDNTRALHVDAVFHTIAGDIESGLWAARAISNPDAHQRLLPHRAADLLPAAFAFARAGLLLEAGVTLRRSLSIAGEYRLAGVAARAARALGWLALAAGDQIAARDCYEIARTWSGNSGVLGRQPRFDVLLARIMLLEGRPSEARDSLGPTSEAVAKDSVLRRRAEHAAISLSAQLALREQPDEALVGTLEAAHLALRNHGACDFYAHTLYLAQSALGDTQRASNTIAAYLIKHRRERTPAPPHLADLGPSRDAPGCVAGERP